MKKRVNGEHIQSICVGDKFVLKCGEEVTVVKYIDYQKIVISDGQFEKCVRGSNLVSGAVGWDNDDTRKGTAFTLKCGTTVFIAEYINNSNVIVSDGKFSKKTSMYALRQGSTLWRPPNEIRPRIKNKRGGNVEELISIIKVGDIYQSNNHGKFKIVSVNGFLKVGIVFENTLNFQFTNANAIRTGAVADAGSWGNNLKASSNYVYIATLDGKVVYVGRGSGDRYQHCNSGTSSSYYLNTLHFSGKFVTVGVVKDNLSLEDSHQEAGYIYDYDDDQELKWVTPEHCFWDDENYMYKDKVIK